MSLVLDSYQLLDTILGAAVSIDSKNKTAMIPPTLRNSQTWKRHNADTLYVIFEGTIDLMLTLIQHTSTKKCL